MTKSFFAGLCFGLSVAVMGVWFAQGMHSATLKEEFVETVTVLKNDDCNDEDFDPDFCIERKREGRPAFKIGLFDLALPASAGLLGVGSALLFIAYRARNTAPESYDS